MSVGMETWEFKSPLRKLTRFFHHSRDRWKEKHHTLKRQCRKLANQVAAVEKSREQWRSQARQLEQRVHELEHELSQQKCQ